MFENSKNKKRVQYIILCILFFLIGITGGFFGMCMTFWYSFNNYTSLQISLLIAMSMFGTLLQIFPGYIANKFHMEKKILYICFIITYILLLIILFTNKFIVIVFVVILMNLTKVTISGILTATIVRFCNDNKANYGMIRSLLSLGIAISTLLSGFYVQHFAIYLFPIVSIFLISICVFLSIHINIEQKEQKEKINFKKLKKTYTKPVFIYYILLLITLSNCGLSTIMRYMPYHLLSLNLSSTIISSVMFLGIFPEMIGMNLSKKIYTHLGYINVLYLCNILAILECIILLTTNNLILVGLAMILGGFINGVFFPIVTLLLFQIVSGNLMTSALLFRGTLTSIVALIYIGFIVTPIYVAVGTKGVFFCVLISLLLALIFLTKFSHKIDAKIKIN